MKRALLAAAAGLALASAGTRANPAAASFPTDDQAIVHVLNRIGFGPRPGDVAKVREIGLRRYIDQQLHPDRITDDELAPRLAGLSTVGLSTREIADRFEIPLLQARRARRESASGQDRGRLESPQPTPDMRQRANQLVLELSQQKLLRAIYSERQLEEVLTDFWFNHFNVDARKGRTRFLVTGYEREAIRPHVLGTFRDLLEATAKSPAMLFYLDNWMSADPNGPHPEVGNAPRPRFRRRRVAGAFGPNDPSTSSGSARGGSRDEREGARAPRGLNENYARELMELHTLGVDGGYTQKDVTEVARAFTGWTIQNPLRGAAFRFEPRIHDRGEKVILGHRLEADGGERDGERVLDLLASHPSTAHFISTKLVRRFVGDTPPASLVHRAAARFRDSGGDLRAVMETILTSPEFLSPGAYRAKVKTPLEFLVSAVRVTGADVREATPLVRAMHQLGMPLYFCQPPTGYKDTADAWVNAGALVNRMNLALALASNQVPGISVDSRQSTVDRHDVVTMILNGEASEATRETIAKATTWSQMVALTLGSPEFQRR
jgi:uncharacterized protein (DUF1800 family)